MFDLFQEMALINLRPESSVPSASASDVPESAPALPDIQLSYVQSEASPAPILLETLSKSTRPETESVEVHIEPSQETPTNTSIENTTGLQVLTHVP